MSLQFSYWEDDSLDTIRKDFCVLNYLEYEYKYDYVNIVKIADTHIMDRMFMYIDLDNEHLKTADDIIEVVSKYKNEVPVFLYVLMENLIIRYIINEVIVNDDIHVFYKYNALYDISNSDTYKKILLLQTSDVTLTDNKIKQMIAQGTELYNNNKLIRT